MNPYVLIGIDLAVSALLILLVLYVALNREAMFAGRGKEPSKAGPAKAPADDHFKEAGPLEETESPFDVSEMTQNAEDLKSEGLSVEQIAGRMKVPKGEVELEDDTDRYLLRLVVQQL